MGLEKIVLNLNRDTAIDLRDALYGLGEHIAAGTPVPEFDTPAAERLRAVLDQLERQLEHS